MGADPARAGAAHLRARAVALASGDRHRGLAGAAGDTAWPGLGGRARGAGRRRCGHDLHAPETSPALVLVTARGLALVSRVLLLAVRLCQPAGRVAGPRLPARA